MDGMEAIILFNSVQSKTVFRCHPKTGARCFGNVDEKKWIILPETGLGRLVIGMLNFRVPLPGRVQWIVFPDF